MRNGKLTMQTARNRHHNQFREPVRDKDSGTRIGWKKSIEYTPFRAWARNQFDPGQCAGKLKRIVEG